MTKKSFKKLAKKILLIAAAVAGVLFLGYIYISYCLPLPQSIFDLSPTQTTKIYDRTGILLYEILNPASGKKTALNFNQFPQKFIEATLSAEDKDYYNHIGVDFNSIVRAIFYNTLEQRIVSGGSTITQQLVRNLLGMNRKRDLGDKIIETEYAIRLSHLYSKEQILERYLNTVYYGNMSYGGQSAALNYFGKNIYDLDLAELTLLAGLPQSPNRFNPLLSFDKAKGRQKYVLTQMVKNHYLTQEEADYAYAEALKFRKNTGEMRAPHFVQKVINQLENEYGEDAVNFGGLTVITTLNYNLQQAAERIIKNNLDKLKDKNVTNGALLATDTKSGQILVWVGSKDYFDEKIDGQVDLITSYRQPGSALKPFLYLQALEEKEFTPATILEDIPVSFETATGPYTPQNYDLTYHGPVRLRVALANSYNIPAVKTLEKIGIAKFIQFLRNFGIQTLNGSPDYYGLALTLGGGEVTLKDMATAYSTLANYGNKKELSNILKISDSQKNSLYEWKIPDSQYVLGNYGKENAYLITNILSDKNARIQSFGEGNILELSHEAAAKTGTTRNFKDNWTFGYTPSFVAGVWVGNSDASSMQNISGIDGAGPIWHDFMEEALKFKSQEKFAIPAPVHQIEICAISGLLPGKLCPEKIIEWFIKGKEPKQSDTYYKLFECKDDSQINPQVKATIDQKVFVDYPMAFKKWAEDKALNPPSNCRLSEDNSQKNTLKNPVENILKTSTEDLFKSQNQSSLENQNSITIFSPLPNDAYKIDSTLPVTSQKIPIKFALNLIDDTEKIDIYMNNQILVTLEKEENSYFWIPKKGKFQLKIKLYFKNGKTILSPLVEFQVI